MKNTITRQELKEIHSIVCQDWKTKLENYAKADPFSETVNFTEKQVQEGLSACSSAEQTSLIKKLFDIKDSWEDIKTVDDAINKLGEKDEEVIQLNKLQSVPGLSETILNNQIAAVITKALNDGWVSNWNDSSEYKYFPWFYLGDSFRCDSYYSWDSGSSTSARLSLKSSELAIYAGKQFTEVYKKFMN
jgi:hypothetical protein